MYLLYFPPDRQNQLVTLLPDDDIKHAMLNKCEKKVVEQGYNYIDDPIDFMVEFFETRIENLEKIISPSVSSRNRNKNKKGSKIRRAATFVNFEDKDTDNEYKGKKLCKYHITCGHTTDECAIPKALIR